MFKIFFDTEFTGLHKDTTLVSIGFITENNDTFYAELDDYDGTQLDKWLADNVIANLYLTNEGLVKNGNNWLYKGSSNELGIILNDWFNAVREGKECEIWGDVIAYDWVLFHDIYGHAFNIPNYIYYIPNDIATLAHIKLGNSDFNRKEFSYLDEVSHNALSDAKMIKACYERLMNEYD